MTTDNQPLLGRWLSRLTLEPLDPTDPGEDRYVELHGAGREAVDDIFSRIDLAQEACASCCQAHRSGKRTWILATSS